MSNSNTPSIPDSVFWPESPKELIVSYLAERVWNEPSIIDALGNILITFKEYGIVHQYVSVTIKPLLKSLGTKPSVAKFILFPNSEPFCPEDTILGSQLSAKALNSILRKHLKNLGILQDYDWREPQGKRPTLPIVPWLLYLSAKNPGDAQRITASALSQILAADKGLPPLLRKRFKPADCDRHVQHFREACAMVRQGRQKRLMEAGGLTSKIVVSRPKLAIMYPKSLLALGPKLLSIEELQAVLRLIPLQLIKRHYAGQQIAIEAKPMPKSAPFSLHASWNTGVSTEQKRAPGSIPLSELALWSAGINPKNGSMLAMLSLVPKKPPSK